MVVAGVVVAKVATPLGAVHTTVLAGPPAAVAVREAGLGPESKVVSSVVVTHQPLTQPVTTVRQSYDGMQALRGGRNWVPACLPLSC